MVAADLFLVDRYQNASYQMVRSQHPGWAPKKIMAEAKKGWEAAALEWMVQTLETCKRKRPRAKWGYFGCTLFALVVPSRC